MKKSTIAAVCLGVVCFLAIAIVVYPMLTLTTVRISGLMMGMTFDDMFEQSSLVVYGEVVSKPQSFKIRSVGGGEMIFTDYYIKPIQVLRGNTDMSDAITVRLYGGTVGDRRELVDGEPVLSKNDKFVLFLYKPARGGGFNTEGDYYYVSGGKQGAFKDAGFLGEDTWLRPEDSDFEEMSFSEIVVLAENANVEIPIDEEYNRNHFLRSIQGNLETGFMQQEEADRLLVEMNTYATIIK